jgi:hypothetical protein
MSAEHEWDESVGSLLGRSSVPAALAAGTLLAEAKPRWLGRVVPRTSMHDLLFTVPGYPYPFEDSVRVAWADGVFTFSLVEGGAVRTADHCHSENAPSVLDAFLAQLVGGEPGPDVDRASDYDRVVAAIHAAWDDGCPVASDPEGMATVALRRVASVGRRLRGTPGREQRIEDLAKGLRDRYEENPKLTGPLVGDYRHLATKIIDAVA